MRLNYNKIGKYIRKVNTRNVDLITTNLLGINIDKFFMPSVANIVGTDMTTYKVVKKGQFACNRMHVGRDYRLPISISTSDEDFLVSPAYDVFEVKNEEELLPEYLMMWFSRKEFDRNSWFYTDADVRGGLHWDTFCDIELPVPSIEKQRAIVKEYNVVKDRIEMNNTLIQKLEETAQAIYKQWFVDFEFPDKNGKPYKSSGGEMVWCEELEKEVPKGWEVAKLEEIISVFDSKRRPLSNHERAGLEKKYPYYGAASVMDYIDDYIFDGTYLLLGEDGTVITDRGTPVLQYVWGKFWVNNHTHVLQGRNGYNVNTLYTLLNNTNISDIVTGGVQSKINQSNLNSIKVLIPSSIVLKSYTDIVDPIFDNRKNQIITKEICNKITHLLLSKLATIND